MSILRVDQVTRSFGEHTVLAGVSFALPRGTKAGLIGANGAGKTTLLRMLIGQDRPDTGQVALPDSFTLGYVEQEGTLTGATLLAELRESYRDVIDWQTQMQELEQQIAAERDEERLAALMRRYAAVVERFERGGGYEYENIIRRVAHGLGFGPEDLERPLDTFSGGQKTRISLARALVRRPDFLLLDEPTNHLDVAMAEWLEDYLNDYPGAVLIVSHDRYFLDQVAKEIFELENGVVTSYQGNYSSYLRQKAERVEAAQSAFERQQAQIAKTEAFIDRYRAGVKSKQARGREKQLSRLERLAAPVSRDGLEFSFDAVAECAERVAEFKRVTAGYEGKPVFRHLSMLIRRGNGAALVGPNGVGKTTLLKVLIGELEPAGGEVRLGSRVKIGYFAQEHENLNPEFQVIEEIVMTYGFGEERARNCLGAFLFRGDDVFKRISDLSGGEKARLSLMKLMLDGANFLVLDEPTNHLDIPAKEAVEEAIMAFPGTFLTVSHDRYFLDKVADRVLELTADGLTEYGGNYSYYREKKAQAAAEAASRLAEQTRREEKAAAESPRQSSGRGRQRPKDNSRILTRLEQEIRVLELELAGLEHRLNDPASHEDPEQSRRLAEEYQEHKNALDHKYGEWLELTEQSQECESGV